MSEPAGGHLPAIEWRRWWRIAAILGCGGLSIVMPGCLLAVAPTGGRLIADGLLDVVLGWTR
jgi:hypothetical protein